VYVSVCVLLSLTWKGFPPQPPTMATHHLLLLLVLPSLAPLPPSLPSPPSPPPHGLTWKPPGPPSPPSLPSPPSRPPHGLTWKGFPPQPLYMACSDFCPCPSLCMSTPSRLQGWPSGAADSSTAPHPSPNRMQVPDEIDKVQGRGVFGVVLVRMHLGTCQQQSAVEEHAGKCKSGRAWLPHMSERAK